MSDELAARAPRTPRSEADADLATRLSRDDLVPLMLAYRTANRRADWRGLLGGLGGLAVGAGLLSLRGWLHWNPALDAVFFSAGWAVALFAAGAALWRKRVARDRYQFRCPSCHAPLLQGTLGRDHFSRAELTVATGVCHECGANVYGDGGAAS